jgi:hypothetical protein
MGITLIDTAITAPLPDYQPLRLGSIRLELDPLEHAAHVEHLDDAMCFSESVADAARLLHEHIERHVSTIADGSQLYLSEQFRQTPVLRLKFLVLQRIMKVAGLYLMPSPSSDDEDELEGEGASQAFLHSPEWSRLKGQIRSQIVDCLAPGERERTAEVKDMADELVDMLEQDDGWKRNGTPGSQQQTRMVHEERNATWWTFDTSIVNG